MPNGAGQIPKASLPLLSDQAMCLYFFKKPSKTDRFSVLGNTFQGQKHGSKDFGIPDPPW